MVTSTKKTKKKSPGTKSTRKAIPKTTAVKVKATPKPVAPKKKKEEEDAGEMGRLRIRVSAYEHKLLDASVKQILDTALRHGAKIRGPVPLPTEIKKYTVNRATFVYKNAREQFEMRIHKRVIDIINPSPPLIEALTNLTLPSGVSIDVKMM